jgi:hypothetical protein
MVTPTPNRVDNYLIHPEENLSAKNKTFFETSVDWFGKSSEASFRVPKALENWLKLAEEIRKKCGMVPSESLSAMRKDASAIWRSTILFSVYGACEDACKAVGDVVSMDSAKAETIVGESTRKIEKMIQNVSDAVSRVFTSLGVLFSYFPKMTFSYNPMRKIAEAASWVADLSGASISVKNFYQAHTLYSHSMQADKATQKVLYETQVRYLFAVVKDVCASTLAVVGVTAMATGGVSLLPPITLVGVGCLGSTAALGGVLYDKSMEKKALDFYNTKHVTIVAA